MKDDSTGQSSPSSSANTQGQTREERLAAQLRENLRRRKSQARGLQAAALDSPSEAD